jgi:hypothetical protein
MALCYPPVLPPMRMTVELLEEDDTSTDHQPVTTRVRALETIREMMNILAILATAIFCVLLSS